MARKAEKAVGLLIFYNNIVNIISVLNSVVARMYTEKNNPSKSISEFIYIHCLTLKLDCLAIKQQKA